MRKTGYVFCLVMFAVCAFAKEPEDKSWSKAVNGIRAKITMRERTVLNGSRIIAVYLNLKNISGGLYPLHIHWKQSGLSLKVVDADGHEFPKVTAMDYSGAMPFDFDLVLPLDGFLSFNLSLSGLGIPKDKAAVLDLGDDDCWIIDKAAGKKYFLKATLTIPRSKDHGHIRYWYGTIDIPKAEIPLK